MVASRSEVSFWPGGSTSPKIMYDFLYAQIYMYVQLISKRSTHYEKKIHYKERC
jgi:hypothetical protein